MRTEKTRKIISTALSAAIMVSSFTVPQYLEVNNIITQENSYFLLYGTYSAWVIVVLLLIWGYHSSVKMVFNKLANLKRLRLKFYYKSENDYTEQAAHEALLTMMKGDIGKAEACIQIVFRRANTQGISATAGPHIIFEFSMLSSSVYRLRFNNGLTGHIRYNGEEIKDSPEFAPGSWISQRPTLLRKQTGTIELRQFLLPEIAKRITELVSKNQRVIFDLRDVYIPIEMVNPLNEKIDLTIKCPLPDNTVFERFEGSIAFPH